MAGTPSAQGSSSGSKSLLWMMLALFGGIGVLLGGGLFLASRMVNALKYQEPGDKSTMQTPIGEVRVQKGAEGVPGLPVYPHAALVLPGDNPKADTAGPSTEFDIRTAFYYSTDSRTLVEDWYGQHLSAEFARHGPQDPPLPDRYKNVKVPKDATAFLAEHGIQSRLVILEDENDGTSIRLLHLSPREPQ